MTHQTEGGRVFRPLAMSISMILAAAAAQAQQPAARGETTEAQGTLQEVVVTAQKREERLQDVPVAVSAIGERQLSSRGIQNVQDLTGLAPNVNVLPAANSNTGSQISIRGSVQQNPALYWDPTVGIYIDGVYLGKNLGNVFDVVDLERVEVLRGPQGTLYGRNTLAGAINLITRQPSGEFRGNVKVDVGNFNLHSARASLDLPRFGIASVSLAVRGEKRDGTTQTMPGSAVRELNNRNSTSARASR
ncbi:MAG: TonB-dependent receptor plug domain-containing protein [Gammaproteobacteria bacterium]|nr:TonB-dependent receptor plug domain-containing protein [Gammaproteobacteria bacterium]